MAASRSDQLLRECPLVPADFGDRALFHPGEGRFESEQARHVVIAGFVFIGESLGW